VTAKQLNRLLDILDRAVKVAERWADREYPQIDENEEGFITGIKEDDPQAEIERQVGRFEQRFRDHAQ
jgi:hypothetical protein